VGATVVGAAVVGATVVGATVVDTTVGEGPVVVTTGWVLSREAVTGEWADPQAETRIPRPDTTTDTVATRMRVIGS